MKFTYKKTISIKEYEKEFDVIAEEIQKLKLPPGFSNSILYVISELFTNIKQHAGVDKGKIFLIIQGNQCLIRVEDQGIGLRRSYLKKKIFPKDDFSAIEFALSGLSTKSSQERGFGLYSIRKLTESLKGMLIIKTGSAKALIQKNKINLYPLSQKFQGTSVEVRLPIKKIDFYKIIT